MLLTTTIQADFEMAAHQYVPNWEPLEAIGLINPGRYMWMSYAILADGARVEAYKHVMTRRYLYLDDRGRAWRYIPGGFEAISIRDAVAHAEG